jgi:transposase InsO family protein
MSRQNWYKEVKIRKRRQVDEGLIVELVRNERKLHVRRGGRKLLVVLKAEFADAGISIGRDRLFGVLTRHDLLVPRLPRSTSTTNSRHSLPIFHNRLKGLEVNAPNQAWVSDITYIRIDDGFVYLGLIMDRYSRKIVGYHCGDRLETAGCLASLDMALADLPEGCHPIHHSDRGCQYCSHDYTDRLQEHGLPVSMTETDHCAENAHAERLNGILKQEYGLGMTFRNLEQVRKAVEQAVWLYNYRRPHMKLKMRIPAMVHQQAA